MWEFYERLSRKAGLSLEHSTRYARHVGNVLGAAVPEEDLATAREELDPEYWELSERVLPDPQYYGAYEQRPDSLKPSDAPIPNGAGRVEIARDPRPVQELKSPHKIKLTKNVLDFSGSPFPKGSVLEARIARDGMLEVVGAQHLPLYPHEWTLVLTDKDMERLISGG